MRRAPFPLVLAVLLLTVAWAGCLTEPVTPTENLPTDSLLNLPPGVSIHLPGGLPTNATLDPALIPHARSHYFKQEAYEPTLGVTKGGTIFASAFDGVGRVLRSTTKGATWEDVTPQVAGIPMPPQSNDPYVHVDVDTGRVFTSDLQALMCSTLSYSDDEGKTWTSNPVGCGHPVGVHDHQTVFTGKPKLTPTVGYPNVVYYCINRIVDTSCATSLNGGLTFGPLRPLVYAGVDPEGHSGGTFPVLCSGMTGHGITTPDGTAFLGKGQCGKPMVAVSEDDGLTWKTTVISNVTLAPSLHGPMAHEVSMASDEKGNVYAIWMGKDYKPYLAASKDKGQTWSRAINVAAPEVTVAGFPVVAAGTEGRVAVAYYGATNGTNYQTAKGNWSGYLGILTNALDAQPVIISAMVNDAENPLAFGECGGTRCGGPGGQVGDFIDIVIDAEGRPWAVLVDVYGDADDMLGGFVGTLASGPALRGELGPLTCLTPCGPVGAS